MLELAFDVLWYALAFGAGWLGPTRPDLVTKMYSWVGEKLVRDS